MLNAQPIQYIHIYVVRLDLAFWAGQKWSIMLFLLQTSSELQFTTVESFIQLLHRAKAWQ